MKSSAATTSTEERLPLAFGAFMLLLLLAFRFEKLLHVRAPLEFGAWDWAALAFPEALFVVAIESALLLTRPRQPRLWTRLWVGVAVAVHAVLLAAAVVEHQFFVSTGTMLTRSVLLYVIRNMEHLLGVVGSAANSQFFLRAAMAALALPLAWSLARRAPAREPSRSRRPKALGALGLAALALMMFPRVAASALPFSSAALVELAFGRGPGGQASGPRVAIREFHRTPKIASAPKRTPNVVLIILESTRADMIDPGKAMSPSPFLSRLAQQGAYFSRAYTTVSHTTKAITGIVCGMYPRVSMDFFEATFGMLPMPCLPELMESLGYRTGYFQTAFEGFENREGLIRNMGFDHWNTGDDLVSKRFQPLAYLGLDDEAMVEPALRWMSADPTPFLVTLLTVITHHPYAVPGVDASGQLDRTRYADAVRHVDSVLQRLFQRMEERGLTENTVFVFVGDHGEAFGEHGRSQHDAVAYEEGIRVPLFVYGPPALVEPGPVEGLRSHVDVVPTILELVGVEWTGKLPGRSLLSTSGHEQVYTGCWYDEHCLSLVTPTRKYIYNFNNGPIEVFDLVDDPQERRNIAGEVAAEEVGKAVMDMQTWRESVRTFYER